MEASYLIEMEKWQEALDRLLTSKIIFGKIAQFKDPMEAVLYDEKIN